MSYRTTVTVWKEKFLTFLDRIFEGWISPTEEQKLRMEEPPAKAWSKELPLNPGLSGLTSRMLGNLVAATPDDEDERIVELEFDVFHGSHNGEVVATEDSIENTVFVFDADFSKTPTRMKYIQQTLDEWVEHGTDLWLLANGGGWRVFVENNPASKVSLTFPESVV